MPYIKQEDRYQVDGEINVLADKLIELTKQNNEVVPVGTLNYCISRLIWRLFDNDPSYTRGSNLRGVLHDVDIEFYRRKVVPLENSKIGENGDI